MRTRNDRADSEVGETRNIEGACGEQEYTAEAVNVGDAGEDGWFQPRVGGGGKDIWI